MIDTLVRRIAVLAESQPDKIAAAHKKERLTYKELYDKILGMAKLLKDRAVLPGDRVCFSAVSKPETLAAYLAIQFLGAVAVPLDKNGTAENIAFIYKECGAKLLLTDKPMKGYADDCNAISLKAIYMEADGVGFDDQSVMFPVDDNTLAEILFTTGTTGRPKGVMLTYKAVYHIFMNTIEGIHISENEILLLPLPLNHSFALRVLRAILYRGATVILQNGFTFAKAVEENINTFGCTGMACVPASYEVMKSQMQDMFGAALSKLVFIEFGAGSLSVRQRHEISNLLPGVQIYNTWGSSETGGAIFCDVTSCVHAFKSGQNSKIVETLGKPLPGKIDIKILSQNAPIDEPEKLSDNLEKYFIDSDEAHPGRMILKGDMQMAGYWNNPEITAQTLIDGWLLTGDMAYLDDVGNVFMLGRADDIINVGGEKVSPVEVENIAGQYEQIKECACIGVDDPEGITGQIPVLFVVDKAGYSEEELIKFVSARTERYKLPQRIVKLQELPRNRMQKTDRKALKRIWENQNMLKLMNPVVETILTRRSIRKFTDQEIPSDILDMILKCGYYAPSGHNMQTWKFTVMTKEADIARLKAATQKAAETTKVHFYGWENPKVLILVSNDTRNPDGCQDASCAAENMMLAARSYGIGSVWLNSLMTLRNVLPVKALLDEMGIPVGHTVWASVALGYPLNEGVLLQKNTNIIKFI